MVRIVTPTERSDWRGLALSRRTTDDNRQVRQDAMGPHGRYQPQMHCQTGAAEAKRRPARFYGALSTPDGGVSPSTRHRRPPSVTANCTCRQPTPDWGMQTRAVRAYRFGRGSGGKDSQARGSGPGVYYPNREHLG